MRKRRAFSFSQDGAMKSVVIIPAGGTGRRMGGEIPKQYLSLAGIPILVHTLKAFQRSPLVDEIILVVPGGDVAEVRRDLVEWHGLSKISLVIAGGRERQDSVRNALAHVRDEHEIILIHDGVRPFVTGGLIERAVAAAKAFGAAVVGVPVRDTVKTVDAAGRVVQTVQREGLWLTQTPQAFRRGVLLAAYERAAADGFYGTDDASLVERMGVPVRMIPGDADNIKVTTPEDLERGGSIIRRLTDGTVE
jgi:2-C-methyl-D-erythritol 4-phosphate cytidylyltransferase